MAPRWLVSALLGASATLLYLLLYAPPLFHVVEAAAAPRWNPKDSRGLVAPAHSASARLLLLERRAEQDD